MLELEYDAIEAYEASIERLESITHRQKLAEFVNYHRQLAKVEDASRAARHPAA